MRITMFSNVLPALNLMPFKAQPIHTYNVCTIIGKVKGDAGSVVTLPDQRRRPIPA